MAKILVTGGAGFVGSYLCERLVRGGDTVVCLDDLSTGTLENVVELSPTGRFHVVRADVMEPPFIEVDAIYHLACPASPVQYQRSPVRTLMTAVLGTERMLALARRLGVRILIASTSEVYGDPAEHPQAETYWGNVNPMGDRACYKEGKRCAEALARSYAMEHGTDVRVARLFNTYGPRMQRGDGRVVSNFVCQALAGEPITIHGDGRQSRSFCFVTDIVEGLVGLMRQPGEPGPVNLGNPTEVTVEELAHLILRLCGSPARLAHEAAPADDSARRRPDIAKARALLGWQPKITLEQGLAATIDYFRNGPPDTRPGPAP